MNPIIAADWLKTPFIFAALRLLQWRPAEESSETVTSCAGLCGVTALLAARKNSSRPAQTKKKLLRFICKETGRQCMAPQQHERRKTRRAGAPQHRQPS